MLSAGPDPVGEAIGTIYPIRHTKGTSHNCVQFGKQPSRIRDHFVVNCFVIAVLRRILHLSYSSEAAM